MKKAIDTTGRITMFFFGGGVIFLLFVPEKFDYFRLNLNVKVIS